MTRTSTRTRTLFTLLIAGAGLAGCQTANTTVVTVMNESLGTVVIDVSRTDQNEYLFENERLDPNRVEKFTIENVDASQIVVDAWPIQLDAGAARRAVFDPGGPYLLRVQGTATDLKLIATMDNVQEMDAGDVQPVYTNRRFNEPPVTPSR